MTDIDQAVPGDYDGDHVAEACIVSADTDNSGCTWFDRSGQIPWGWKLVMPYSTDSIPVGLPPATPTVADSGPYTTDLTRIQASWISTDMAYGIAEYKYAIGTVPMGSNVAAWQSVGLDTSVNRGNLSLAHGRKYYVSVKARNGNGVWSTAGVSDGIVAVDLKAPNTIRSRPDGTSVSMPCVAVTALFSGAFYVRELNGASGMRIQGSPAGASVGDCVAVSGTLGTIDGERVFMSPTVALLE